MPLFFEAMTIAEALVEAIHPHCERVEIAGSLRRRKDVVKDIEICVIPRTEMRPDPSNLFAEPVNTDVLYADWAVRGSSFICGESTTVNEVRWIKPATEEIIDWPVKPFGKYWRGLLPGQIKLDLFLLTEETWPVLFLIRTGSREFNLGLIDYAKNRRGVVIEHGNLIDHGRTVRSVKEETDVFDYLGLEYVKPQERRDKSAIRPKG
jgi:DNA polymerase/3'-5' exonuclease PolX